MVTSKLENQWGSFIAISYSIEVLINVISPESEYVRDTMLSAHKNGDCYQFSQLTN